MPFYYNFRPAIPNEAFSKTFQAAVNCFPGRGGKAGECVPLKRGVTVFHYGQGMVIQDVGQK